jgi:uncharacterized protein (DUF362 family)
MSRVVIIREKRVFAADNTLDKKILTRMFEKGLSALIGGWNKETSLALLDKKDRIGIKINTIAGMELSSRPEVPFSLADLLTKAGFEEQNIIVWDRTNRELKEAGYRLNMNRNGIRVFGTDSQGVGYGQKLISHLNIGSLFSLIQTLFTSSSISLAILKDHGLAGVSASMKNYFGAIHNPNKYHDTNCNPYVSELFDTQQIKGKNKLAVLDGTVVQYHRGPSYHPRWAEKLGILILSRDAVAADFVGWQIIEQLRAGKGLPSLKEEKRSPSYLRTAERMGIGKANRNEIKIIEEEI